MTRTGQLTHIMSVVRNIDERKRIEEALRESHRRYDTLVNNIPAMVYQVRRTPDGEMRFDYVSPTSTKYVGHTPQAIIDDPSLIYNQIDPAYRESLVAAQDNFSVTSRRWCGKGGEAMTVKNTGCVSSQFRCDWTMERFCGTACISISPHRNRLSRS